MRRYFSVRWALLSGLAAPVVLLQAGGCVGGDVLRQSVLFTATQGLFFLLDNAVVAFR